MPRVTDRGDFGHHRNDMLDALTRETSTVPPHDDACDCDAFLLGTGLLFAAAALGARTKASAIRALRSRSSTRAFTGFDEKEVNVESKSFQCRTRICLVNHFRGRVSCPYGQSRRRERSARRRSPCTVPGNDTSRHRPQAGAGRPRRQLPRPAQEGARACAVHRSRGRQGRLLLVPLRRHQRPDAERPDLLRVPRRLHVRAARHVDRQRHHEGLTGSYCIKNTTKYDPGHRLHAGRLRPAATKCRAQ